MIKVYAKTEVEKNEEVFGLLDIVVNHCLSTRRVNKKDCVLELEIQTRDIPNRLISFFSNLKNFEIIITSEEDSLEGEFSENEEKSNIQNEEIQNEKFSKQINTQPNNLMKDLERLAEESDSYETFIKKIVDGLKFSKNINVYISLLSVLCDVDEISWPKLYDKLHENGLKFTKKEQDCFYWKVKQKYQIVPFRFFEEVLKFKNHFNGTINNNSPEKEEVVDSIPNELKERLNEINKNQSINDRIKNVLSIIGYDKLKKEVQEQIITIVNKSIGKRHIDVKNICLECNIPIEVEMNFSKLINDYLVKYNIREKMQTSTFISIVQEYILNEKEFEK